MTGYGYAPDALRGTPVADLLHPEERAGGMQAIRRAITSKAQRPGHYPCQVRAEDGTWRHVEATVSRYRDPGQPDLVLITARDMSAQVALRRQVTHLTFHDGLTGLPNRAYAEQRAHDVLSEDRNAAAAALAMADPPLPGVIVVDIDGFTAVNDARGHTAGDLLLAQVARRLRLAVSPEDTVARWGGDEFAVITEATVSAAELADIAERLARGVASMPFRIGDSDLNITASVGAALADGSPAAHMWRNAEMALARAKAAGAGQVELFGASDEAATAGAGQAGMFGAGATPAPGNRSRHRPKPPRRSSPARHEPPARPGGARLPSHTPRRNCSQVDGSDPMDHSGLHAWWPHSRTSQARGSLTSDYPRATPTARGRRGFLLPAFT